MPLSYRLLRHMPTSGVCIREPAHECRKVAILSRIQDQMPVVGHQAVRKEAHTKLVDCFFKDAFKKLIILFGIEYLCSRIGAVYDVIHVITDIGTLNAGHVYMVPLNGG